MKLRTISYEEATIEQVQLLMKKEIFTEIIFDGDNKTIGVSEEEAKEAEKRISEIYEDIMKFITPIAENLVESLIQVSKVIGEIVGTTYDAAKKAVEGVYNAIYPMMNKKISKKKFIKLLQSYGIQRNKINEIIKNNKEPYTYFRLYKIIDLEDK